MLDRSPGSAKDHIGYQALTQAALRGVVRAALDKAAKLWNTCRASTTSTSPSARARQGVQMADYLKDRFPDEMTIVIQHQYWDFEVFDDRFEIILKFCGVPQHLRIPFAAVTRFFDPSVNFGVQFDRDEAVAFCRSRRGARPRCRRAAQRRRHRPETADGTVVSLDAFRRK